MGDGKVYPPKSTPWFAPEWHPRGFFIDSAKKLDIFSLAMVCLSVLLEHVCHQLPVSTFTVSSESSSLPFAEEGSALCVLEDWKARKNLPDLAEQVLGYLDVADERDKDSLKTFFRRALQHEISERESDILRLVAGLEGYG